MATIHHATVKAAAAKGVTLTNDEDGVTAAIQTKAGERTFSIGVDDAAPNTEWTEAAKDMWAKLVDALAFEAEHPGFQIETEDGDFVARSTEDGDVVASDPDYEDLLVTLREMADEAEANDDGEDDEEKDSRSVVPPTYKRQYAERGHPAHCGDWLAVTLNGFCLGDEGTSIERMLQIAEANGIGAKAEGYLANRSNGWQGRFRMSTRNVLAKVVATAGVLHVPAEASDGKGDLEIEPPAAWIADHLPKAKGKAAVSA